MNFEQLVENKLLIFNQLNFYLKKLLVLMLVINFQNFNFKSLLSLK